MKDQNEPLAKLIPKFLNDLEQSGRSPSTILAYSSDLEQLSQYLSHRNIARLVDIKTSDIESFRDYLIASKYTSKSVARKLNAIKTFFRWSKMNQYISEDRSKNVVHPKIEVSRPKFLSPIEYRALRDFARTDTKVAAMVELMLQCGLRISEVASLKYTDIKTDSLTIDAYATQEKRIIPLNERVREAVENYLRERPESDSPFLFVSKNGKPLVVRNIRTVLDRHMSKAGISGYSVNDLRNTFIVENLKRGVDVLTLSVAAGHKRVSTTERYLPLAQVSQTGTTKKLAVL